MESVKRNTSENVEKISPWHRSMLATAVISAVFSLIVVAFLILNYGQSKIVDTEAEAQLTNLRSLVRTQPDNEELLSQVRTLDLRIRQRRLRAVDRSRKGSYLLLGSVAVLLISVKFADTSKKGMPSPRSLASSPNEQVREATLARRAVIASLLILGAVSLLLGVLGPHADFRETGVPTASWPSMEEIGRNWPSFRGPGGLGISPYTNAPGRWDGRTSEGILWKTRVPLPGNNSPIIWNDRVFLSGADPNKQQVYCFNALSGELLWKGDVLGLPRTAEEPLEPMEDTGFAAPTVATDGRRVYAIFATGDVGCFDFHGRKVWERSLGIPDSAYGYASSLAMYQNLLLIQYDQGSVEDEKSSLIALDGISGNTVWQTKRPVANSWSSPIVVRIGSQLQIITCGAPWVIGYDPANGAELWRADCLSGDVAPSPIYANGLIFAIEAYSKLVAIRPDGRGDVTDTHIAWSIEEGGPDICSPVSDGQLIFLLATEGWLTCYRLSDRTKLWEKDMKEYFKASPTLVGDNLYLLSEKGATVIIESGPEYKELARCELGESCNASPAFTDGHIFIRGVENLYCIGNSD